MIEEWEDENGKWRKERNLLFHIEKSQKYIDEHPPIEPKPQLPTEIELLKRENELLKQEDLNNKEAILELYMLALGGI